MKMLRACVITSGQRSGGGGSSSRPPGSRVPAKDAFHRPSPKEPAKRSASGVASSSSSAKGTGDHKLAGPTLRWDLQLLSSWAKQRMKMAFA